MKLKSLALALAIFIAGVGEAMSGGVPYPSNINTLPTSGLTANHFLLGDTIQGLKDSGYSTVPCASGGTGLTSGTPGGIPYFSATCTLLSSVALSNHALIIGGLAGAGPHPMATLGTTSQVLIGGGLGDPTWGTPPAGPCAAATLSVLGCVFAPTTPTPAHQFLNGYNGTVWTSAQPDFADLTGTIGCGAIPALTGDITSTAGSCATTVAKIQGKVVSGTTGITNVVFSGSPTFTGTANFAGILASSQIKSNLAAGFAIDAAGGTARIYALQSAGLNRWGFVAANTPETGSGNTGSDMRINRYDDTGTFIDAPISVLRSTGVVTIADGVVITGAGGACTNQFVKSISTSMVPTCATINLATDVTGTFGCAQMPAETGDVTSPAGSCVNTVAKIAGTTVGGTTGTGNVMFSASPTFTGTLTGASVLLSGAGGACTNQFVRSISTALIPTCASVSLATDVTGTLAPAAFGPLTGDVSTLGYAAVIQKIQGTAVGGTSGTGNVAFTASPTFTGTSTFAGVVITGAGGSCTNQFVKAISTSMIATCATINLATDVSGTFGCAQMPAETGDVTSPAGSCVNTVAAIQGTTVTGTTGTAKVAFSASPTFTGTANFAALTATGTIKTTSQPTGFMVDAAAATFRSYIAATAGLPRWAWGANGTAESTGNVGSDFQLYRFNDAGTTIDQPITVTRATGVVTFADGVVITGAGGTCTNQFVRSLSTGMIATCATVNLATDVTGTLPPADCPPAVSGGAIGCMFAPASPTPVHQFLTGYNGTTWSSAQPDVSDLTGVFSCAQRPAETGDVTSPAGSCATTLAKIQGTTVTGTTGTGSAVLSASPTLTGTALANNLTASGLIKSNLPTGFAIDAAAGTSRAYLLQSSSLSRWGFVAANTAESTGNVGSDMRINRYDDSGAFIDAPISALRSTGKVTIADGITITGAGVTCTNQFVRTIPTSMIGTCASVNLASDVTGALPSGSFGPLTGDVTTVGYAATVAKIGGTTVGGSTGSGNVAFSAAPTFTGTALAASLTASGTIKSTLTGSTVTGFAADGPAGTFRSYGIQTGGLLRWGVSGSQGAESTGNAGTDFQINRFDDTGVGIDNPFFIRRSTGVVNILDGVVITGAGATCSNQFVRSISTAMIGTCASVNLASDVTGLLPSASCPPSTGLALGCMFAPATPTPVHQFVKGYNGTIWQTAQPDFTDLTGSIACAQEPAWTGDITSPAGSCATSVAAIQGTVVTGTTGTGKVAFDTAPSFNGAASFVDLNATGNIRSSSLAPAAIGVDAAAGTQRSMGFFSSGSMRWAFRVTNTAESGANVGSDILFRRFDDTGTAIDNPMQITRSTGVVAFADGLSVAAGGVNIVTGGLNVGSGGVVNSSFITPQEAISFATPINRSIAFQTNLIDRWQIRANGSTESGANVGTDFSIRRYDDAGVFLDAPISVVRSTGVVTFADPVVLTGAGATCANAFVRTITTSMIGTCSAVNLALDVTGLLPFTSLSGVPTTVAGYGITDALKTTNNLSDLTNAQTAKTNLGINRLFTTSDFTKVNTTSLNVPGLAITGIAGKTYSIRAAIHLTVDAVSGFRIRMGGTSTASFDIYQVNAVCDTTGAMIAAQRITDWATTNLNYTGGCTSVFVTFDGTVNISANGTIVPQFATGTGVVTATLLQGSFIEYNLLN